MRSPLYSPQIIRARQPGETVFIQGQAFVWPSETDIQLAEQLTRQQESLFARFSRLGTSEQAEGEKASIQRRVARKELLKHPLLQTHRLHLMPDAIRRRLTVREV